MRCVLFTFWGARSENYSHIPSLYKNRKKSLIPSSSFNFLAKIDYNIDPALKAEILWTLKVASSNFSFASSNDNDSLFQEMFPDSEIASKFKMARTKNTYLLNFGIAEHIVEELKRDSLNTVFGYNSKTFKKVVTRYVSSELVGHCTADHLKDIFFNKVKSMNLDLSYLLQLGMDGPNTNLSFRKKVSDKIVETSIKSH